MAMWDEAARGLERLKEIFENRRILRMREPTPLRDRLAYYFVVSAFEKEWDFTLSCEELSDLPSMKTYQDSANQFARILEKRFINLSPNLFYCRSGRAVLIEPSWPMEAWANRAASYVRVKVQDFKSGEIALCFVVITHQQSIFDLKEDLFALHKGLVNSVRKAVDQSNVVFYPKSAQPLELQKVSLDLQEQPQVTNLQIDEFILRKIFWLGFKADNSGRRVWMPDPWDASYLGVSLREMLQAVQILAARNDLMLDETGEFASIGPNLLARARDFERDVTPHAHVGAEERSWDVFISHATEDKDTFVRPLASFLKNKGLNVWYDEFSLRLGDSLRRSIDEGLGKSRFGIVVLSPSFFAKEWPQKELDALVGRESGGAKVILPVWHNISGAGVRQYSPLLADRFAVSSEQGLDAVGDKIIRAVAAAEERK